MPVSVPLSSLSRQLMTVAQVVRKDTGINVHNFAGSQAFVPLILIQKLMGDRHVLQA